MVDSDGVAVRYVGLLPLLVNDNDVLFAHDGQEQTIRKGVYLKWLAIGLHRFDAARILSGSTRPRENLMPTIVLL